MLNFLVLGLLWTAIYALLYKSLQLKLENALTILPSTIIRASLPFILAIICARLSKDQTFPLYILTPTLTISIYLFFKDIIQKKQTHVNSFLEKMLSKNSSLIKHYDIIIFYITLVLFLLIFGVK